MFLQVVSFLIHLAGRIAMKKEDPVGRVALRAVSCSSALHNYSTEEDKLIHPGASAPVL